MEQQKSEVEALKKRLEEEQRMRESVEQERLAHEERLARALDEERLKALRETEAAQKLIEEKHKSELAGVEKLQKIQEALLAASEQKRALKE